MNYSRKNKVNINEKRKALQHHYQHTTFKILKTINSITKRSSNDKNAVFDDLMRILYDEGTLIQAMGNISKKKAH